MALFTLLMHFYCPYCHYQYAMESFIHICGLNFSGHVFLCCSEFLAATAFLTCACWLNKDFVHFMLEQTDARQTETYSSQEG